MHGKEAEYDISTDRYPAEFSLARKAFRALTKKARAEALRQLEEEEVKQEPPQPAGENLGSGEVFCCKRCNARSHEKCQDGDGEHCNACGEVVEAEIIAAMRAEDDARAQAPDSSQGVPVTKPVVEEPPAAIQEGWSFVQFNKRNKFDFLVVLAKLVMTYCPVH